MTEEQEDEADNSDDDSHFVALSLVLVHHLIWSAPSMDVHSVNFLLEELLHSQLDGITATARYHWARGVDLRFVALSPWGVNLLWVP